MSCCSFFFCSTIGKKQLVGVTGLALSLFVLSHMLGNLFIFVSPQAYNSYSHTLISNPLIYVAELGLIVMFMTHLGLALKLSFINFKARTQGYAVSARGDKGTDLITKTMWHQGVIILVFVVFHLITFKFGTFYEVTYEGVVMRDLHRLVLEVFQNPAYVAWYLFSLLILGFHLSHGVSSALQTLGFNHPRYTSIVKKIGWAYALAVSVGFASQPIYVFMIDSQ